MLWHSCIEVGSEIPSMPQGTRIDSNYVYQPLSVYPAQEPLQEYGGGLIAPSERGNSFIGGWVQLN